MDALPPFLEHFPRIGLFVLLLLGGMGLPFPEDATLVLSGFLISVRVIRPVPALLTLYLGVLTADVLLYHIGKRFGRNIVTHRRFRRLLSGERLSRLEERFRRNGFLFVLLGRHLAGLRAQVFLAAGIMRMPFRTFVVADGLSSLGTIGVMVGIGYAGGSSLEVLRKDLTRIEHWGVAAAAGAVLVLVMLRYARSRGRLDGR